LLVSGTNAIVINAAATDKVTIAGLDINGIGTGAQTSLNGIKVLSARMVRIYDNEIYRFQSGVTVAPTSSQTSVVMTNNHIHNNGIGVINAPGSNAISFTAITMRNNNVQDNVCGAVTSAFGTNGSTPVAATNCGTNTAASGINKPAVITAFGNGFNLNGPGAGLTSRGASATFDIGRNDITGNTVGISLLDGGHARTFGNNEIVNNGSTTAPDQTATFALKRKKK
jgi:hypothetical protein